MIVPAKARLVASRDRPTLTHSRCRREGVLFASFTASLAALQLAISRSGHHDQALAALGNSWDDLSRLQVQRLATTSLIQSNNGLQLSIVGLLIAATIAAVLRVSARRAFTVWFIADIVASIILFSSYRIVAGLGSTRALELTATRDAGSSSGAHAVITAALLTISQPRNRFLAVGLLVAAQIPFIVIRGNPAFAHHIIAIATTVVVSHFLDLRSSQTTTIGTT